MSALPLIPSTTISRSVRRTATLAAMVVALTFAAYAALAQSPTPAAANGPLSWMTAEAPYVHSDFIGRRWIYAAATDNSTAYTNIKVQLFQYYGGAWHVVATNEQTKTYNRVIARVLCTGGRRNYPFFTRATIRHNGQTATKSSRVVTHGC